MPNHGFFPVTKIMSTEEGYSPTGPEVMSGKSYVVGLILTSTGGDPIYSFYNISGHVFHRSDGKDHFGDKNYNGNSKIIFLIKNSPGWSFDDSDPIKFIEQKHTQFYYARMENETTMTLSVTRNDVDPADWIHTFNIYLLENGKRRKVDPDQDNPPH